MEEGNRLDGNSSRLLSDVTLKTVRDSVIAELRAIPPDTRLATLRERVAKAGKIVDGEWILSLIDKAIASDSACQTCDDTGATKHE